MTDIPRGRRDELLLPLGEREIVGVETKAKKTSRKNRKPGSGAKKPPIGPKVNTGGVGRSIGTAGLGPEDDGDNDGFASGPDGNDNVPVGFGVPSLPDGPGGNGLSPSLDPPSSDTEFLARLPRRVPPHMDAPDDRVLIAPYPNGPKDRGIERANFILQALAGINGVDPHDGINGVTVIIGGDAQGGNGLFVATADSTGERMDGLIQVADGVLDPFEPEGFLWAVLAHEFGHRIDVKYPVGERPGDRDPAVGAVHDWHSHQNTPAMTALFDAISKNRDHRRRLSVVTNKNLKKSDREYFLSRQEIWARVYAQWSLEKIATQTGRKDILRHINRMRDSKYPDSYYGKYQFSDAEMRVYGPLVEAVLHERGLRT